MKPAIIKPLNLRQIEVFRAVMVAGSISGAAQMLHVSQPAVSRLLSHTEYCLGFQLFERIKGRLYATPEAKTLFHEVQSVYAGVQRVNDAARGFAEHRGGVLRIVAHSTIGQMLVPEAIAAFHAEYPLVNLTFECLRQDLLQERLLQTPTDLAVTIFPINHPSLAVEHLCNISLVGVMRTDHPLAAFDQITPAALQGFPLISYPPSSPFGILFATLFADSDRPASGIEVGSPQNAAIMAQLGMGVALMDEFSAYPSAALGMAVRPIAQAAAFEATMVHRQFQPMSQATQAFVTVMRDVVRKRGHLPAA